MYTIYTDIAKMKLLRRKKYLCAEGKDEIGYRFLEIRVCGRYLESILYTL